MKFLYPPPPALRAFQSALSQGVKPKAVHFGVSRPTAQGFSDQVQGALFALAAGDALGCNLETLTADEIQQRVGRQTEIVGGRTRNDFYNWPRGAVTDDTEMTLLVAESLIQAPQWDVWACLRGFVTWFKTNPQGLGKTTIIALKDAQKQIEQPEFNPAQSDFARGAKLSWDTLRSPGNGSLMRCSPIGLMYARHAEKLKQASLESCRITHEAPLCQASTLAYNRILAAVVRGEVTSTQSLDRLLETTAQEAEGIDPQTAAVIRRVPTQTLAGLNPKGGNALNTLEVALWAFYHVDNLEEALITVANRGGDTDTNAAVAGALLGAQYGLNAVPLRWRQALLVSPQIEDVANRLVRVSNLL